MHSLLLKLMSSYPPETTGSQLASRYTELETVYSTIYKVITEGLDSYEKNKVPAFASLFGPFMLLKVSIFE